MTQSYCAQGPYGLYKNQEDGYIFTEKTISLTPIHKNNSPG